MGAFDGLDGIVAVETVLSDVDGEAGRLVIRGRSLDELVGRWTYEELAGLLWGGFFDDLPDDLRAPLGEARSAVFAEVAALDSGLIAKSTVENSPNALIVRTRDLKSLTSGTENVALPAEGPGAFWPM